MEGHVKKLRDSETLETAECANDGKRKLSVKESEVYKTV